LSDELVTPSDMNENSAIEVGAGEASALDSSPDAPDASDATAGLMTVGQKLRGAREAANLSATDVAQVLKFSQRQIELLEADNYAALPGNTIVRGFVRSYARFLKLDPEALLRMLDERSPTAPADVRPPENMGIASEADGLRQYTPMVSIIIVISLAALLLGLWHYFGPAVTKPGSGLLGSERQSASPDAVVVAAPAATATTASSQPSEAVAPAPVTNAPDGASGPVLIFTFEGRSWVEVTDATGQKVHSGENPAGGRLTLGGRPPFEIVVGNAEKVKLTYGERVIDLAPHTRADVARLKLE
jgi:cytoskeleton protein RodZ